MTIRNLKPESRELKDAFVRPLLPLIADMADLAETQMCGVHTALMVINAGNLAISRASQFKGLSPERYDRLTFAATTFVVLGPTLLRALLYSSENAESIAQVRYNRHLSTFEALRPVAGGIVLLENFPCRGPLVQFGSMYETRQSIIETMYWPFVPMMQRMADIENLESVHRVADQLAQFAEAIYDRDVLSKMPTAHAKTAMMFLRCQLRMLCTMFFGEVFALAIAPFVEQSIDEMINVH